MTNEVNKQLLDALEAMCEIYIPEDDVWDLVKDINPHDPMYPIHFARAVERKHGIGAE